MSESLPASVLAPGATHRFVSPHYDDIALSCGGLASLLAQAGAAPRVEVVFGEEPDPKAPLSAFAEAMHDGWGLSAGLVVASRRAEEAVAARTLGVVSGNLPFRDAIYRGDHYLSDEHLFGSPAAAESGLPEEMATSLGLPSPPDGSAVIYVPLAIGGHVDHQHAFRMGVALARDGWPVRFYEDLPYALKPGAFEARMAAIAETGVSLEPTVVVPVGESWETKLDAIFAYPSQLDTIFRQYVGVGTTREEIGGVLMEYATRIGDGEPAERYWTLA